MRGRKPIPTHLKVLRGNPGHQALRPELEPTLLWPILGYNAVNFRY
jgi:hypothetical protein